MTVGKFALVLSWLPCADESFTLLVVPLVPVPVQDGPYAYLVHPSYTGIFVQVDAASLEFR